jgi:hypothetical protein
VLTKILIYKNIRIKKNLNKIYAKLRTKVHILKRGELNFASPIYQKKEVNLGK